MADGYSCQRCERTDLKLTQNGRIKTHCANGKRANPETNPHCPGGSDWPREHVRAMAGQGDAASAALLSAWGEDPSGDGTAVHTHRFEYADDDNGHSGSFCECGEEEGAGSASGSYGTGPNPHRRPVPTGKPEALAQGWSEEEWDDFSKPGGALRRALAQGTAVATGDGAWPVTTRQPSSPAGTTMGPTSGPSSTPGTAGSADTAMNESTKATSFVQSAAETTSTPSAPKTGSASSNDATAFLTGNAAGANDVPRDRWGRYLLPHPGTGRVQPWTRVTTLAKSVADTFALSMWQQRMAVKGVTLRPDLYALASGYDVSADKDDLNSVCEQARNAAGDKVAANLGTAMHNFTARVDKGEKVNIPPTMQSDVDAYVAALAAYGFRIVPVLIERRVALTKDATGWRDSDGTVHTGEDIGGTFDRAYEATRDVDLKMANGTVVHLKAGDRVIGDLKTGRDLGYGWGEIAIQETIYAHALNQNGTWDPDGGVWEPLLPGEKVREDVGIVVHLPIQKKPGVPACTLWAVDLEQGWQAVKLCVEVRTWRKAKKIAAQLDVVDQAPRPAAVPAPVTVTEPQEAAPAYNRPTAAQLTDHPSVARETAVQAPPQATPAARKPTWEERAGAVSTKAEASEIYREMRPQVQKIGQTRFNAVVELMQHRLRTLVEQGG